MAEQKKDSVVATTSDVEVTRKTEYTVEKAPKLPSQNVSVERPEPMIDTALVELRNAEAKAQADRLK